LEECRLKLETLNAAATEKFVKLLDGIFEHSPWIVAETAKLKPFSSVDELFGAMESVVTSATHEQKAALINAHPRLGSAGKMTKNSTGEQQGAGLRNLEEEEAAAFSKLNAEYEETFDFPFIMAVRGKTKSEIYAVMKTRLSNAKKDEFETAIEEILRIACFRLDDLLQAGDK
jgi:OHCU decarboxylase